MLPRRCAICDAALFANNALGAACCTRCIHGLTRIVPPTCQLCGISLVSEYQQCMRCRREEFAFTSVRPAYEYRRDIATLIKTYKIAGERSLRNIFGRALYRLWRKFYHGLPVIPAPANPRNLRKRGWDQGIDLISAMRKWARRDMDNIEYFNALRRRSTRSQKKLNRDERLSNLRGAIFCPQNIELPSKVVLLDDVFTTGATLNECAITLRRHGVIEIYGLVIAIH